MRGSYTVALCVAVSFTDDGEDDALQKLRVGIAKATPPDDATTTGTAKLDSFTGSVGTGGDGDGTAIVTAVVVVTAVVDVDGTAVVVGTVVVVDGTGVSGGDGATGARLVLDTGRSNVADTLLVAVFIDPECECEDEGESAKEADGKINDEVSEDDKLGVVGDTVRGLLLDLVSVAKPELTCTAAVNVVRVAVLVPLAETLRVLEAVAVRDGVAACVFVCDCVRVGAGVRNTERENDIVLVGAGVVVEDSLGDSVCVGAGVTVAEFVCDLVLVAVHVRVGTGVRVAEPVRVFAVADAVRVNENEAVRVGAGVTVFVPVAD